MLEVRCQCLAFAPWSAAVVPETTAVRSGVVRWLVAFSLAVGTFTKITSHNLIPQKYFHPTNYHGSGNSGVQPNSIFSLIRHWAVFTCGLKVDHYAVYW